MSILDFIVRLIFIPGIFILIIFFIFEAIKDVRKWRKLFIPVDRKTHYRKRKAAQVYTGPMVNLNSYPKLPKSSDGVILSHK